MPPTRMAPVKGPEMGRSPFSFQDPEHITELWIQRVRG